MAAGHPLTDELERRISELQLELKQREGQQGRTGRSSRATQTNQPSQSVQIDLTIRAGPLTSPFRPACTC